MNENLINLFIALGVGLLIGLERGWHHRNAGEGHRIAGLRTYGLLGLSGGAIGLLSNDSLVLAGISLLAITLSLLVGYLIEVNRDHDIGMTSLIAGILTFILGMAATQGYTTEAAAAAVISSLLMGYKTLLHSVINTLKPNELQATFKMLLISVVILPVLPNTTIDPWQVINPYQIWWMVVLITSISFSGYFAIKYAGADRGILLTGFFAGFASSTALTLSFSRLGKQHPHHRLLINAAILLACGTMFPRILLVSSIINHQLFYELWPSILIMCSITYISASIMILQARKTNQISTITSDTKLKNPFEFIPALMFAALLTLILLLSDWLKQNYGDQGILSISVISGIADVDPLTLSLSTMSLSEIDIKLAAYGILIAAAVNSLVKGVIAIIAGSAANNKVILAVLSSSIFCASLLHIL